MGAGLRILNDATIIFKIEPVSRILTNIFYFLNFAEEFFLIMFLFASDQNFNMWFSRNEFSKKFEDLFTRT